jgi:hypothetical protein
MGEDEMITEEQAKRRVAEMVCPMCEIRGKKVKMVRHSAVDVAGHSLGMKCQRCNGLSAVDLLTKQEILAQIDPWNGGTKKRKTNQEEQSE